MKKILGRVGFGSARGLLLALSDLIWTYVSFLCSLWVCGFSVFLLPPQYSSLWPLPVFLIAILSAERLYAALMPSEPEELRRVLIGLAVFHFLVAMALFTSEQGSEYSPFFFLFSF
ncbi:MAG: hypothetical protein MK135_17660, partial [Polyangiaceae bacterium]|nr:hypothetical protein [Polyangiaceae bacterium]